MAGTSTGMTSTTDASTSTTNTPVTESSTTNDPSMATEPTSEPTGDPSMATSTTMTTTTMATATDPTAATETATETGETGETSDTEETGDTTGAVGVCGDGKLEGAEACDDSNVKTELSSSKKQPLAYDESSCIDDCSLVLSLCGNGKVDPGEACDDGNQDSYDECTTSCTVNDGDYHAPCKRQCEKNCDTDVSSGTFTGCDNVEVPKGGAAVCYVSTKFVLAPRHFAEGECSVTAQSCDGGVLCPPDIGDYDMLKTCPDGTALVDRTTEKAGIQVHTKVCQKTCESDSECRWNAYDSIYGVPGQFRCQTTKESQGVKICADAQN